MRNYFHDFTLLFTAFKLLGILHWSWFYTLLPSIVFFVWVAAVWTYWQIRMPSIERQIHDQLSAIEENINASIQKDKDNED